MSSLKGVPMKKFLVLSLLLALAAGTSFGSNAKLISTADLAAMLDKGNVSVIDLRSDIAQYLQGHIPDATYLHYENLRVTGGGIPADVHSVDAYATMFSRLGLRPDRPVVIYSAGESNNFYATFLAWILDGFGHKGVYLLDGGYAKWAKENRTVDLKYPKVKTTKYPSKTFTPDIARFQQVRDAVAAGTAVLVDARPTDQFEGKAGAQMRRGHIPGAVSHVWASDLMDSDQGKVWKSVEEIRASYEKQGITPDKEIITYCNTGTEASHLYFALRNILGYPKVKVYVPSFTEWSEREDTEVVGPASGK